MPTFPGGLVTDTVRFVHAADLHLDAPFKGVDATDPRVRDALVASTYEALDAVVALCLAERVDFLVLAGDVYNSAEKSLQAEFAFRDACLRLAAAGVRVFLAHGNHDPASSRSFGLELPPEVHVFAADEVERVVFERDGVPVCALYGRSFKTGAETANLARGFKRHRNDAIAIGVLHANVGGRTDYEPYAPCSLDDLRAARMDYWALGHIHKPEVLSEDPAIVYAGCTQGLQPNESGMRGCRLVTASPGSVTSEFVPTSAVVWSAGTVDVSDLGTLDELRAALDDVVDAAGREAGDRPVVLRIELAGRAEVHALLTAPGVLRDLTADARADALDREPWVWVDRIADRTRPVLDVGVLREGEDLAGDLVRLADALAADPRALEALVAEVVGPVAGVLDRREAPDIDAVSLVERARDLALDRLLAGEES